MPPPQESWRQARSELEPFLKEQPENDGLIEDLALINMGLGDKAAALALSERAMAASPDRERRRDWSRSDRDLCSRGCADGGTRPRHCRFTETALDAVRAGALASKRAAHSCAAPARSNVRSAPE